MTKAQPPSNSVGVTETDPKTATFSEDELQRVAFDDVRGQSCWCGIDYAADDDGSAYCPRCRSAYAEKAN